MSIKTRKIRGKHSKTYPFSRLIFLITLALLSLAAAQYQQGYAGQQAEQHEENIRKQENEAYKPKEMANQAKTKRKKDSRRVKRILQHASRGDYYRILGLRNREIKIPSTSIGIGKFRIKLPGFSLFHISDRRIRSAYRSTCRKVHPDRNRDPLANQAFIALEEAASILLDADKRARYDEALFASRAARRQKVGNVVQIALRNVVFVLQKILVVRKVLGPFAFSVLILVPLIV
jgi:hypothetical protein